MQTNRKFLSLIKQNIALLVFKAKLIDFLVNQLLKENIKLFSLLKSLATLCLCVVVSLLGLPLMTIFNIDNPADYFHD